MRFEPIVYKASSSIVFRLFEKYMIHGIESLMKGNENCTCKTTITLRISYHFSEAHQSMVGGVLGPTSMMDFMYIIVEF